MRWLTVLAIVLGSFTGLNAEDVQKATGEELFQKVDKEIRDQVPAMLREGLKEVTVEMGIPYVDRPSGPVKLDIYRSSTHTSTEPKPAVVVIHGGSWKSGDRRQLGLYAASLARRGYIAFAIDYRLAPKHPWPAQWEDVRDAVIYVRREAKKLGIDPDRIGAVGYSAGGHLASMLAVNGAKESSASEPKISAKVSCAAAGGAPCDFSQMPLDNNFLKYWLGATRKEAPDVYLHASPLQQVSHLAAPMFFYNGVMDFMVRPNSAADLSKSLKKFGIDTAQHLVPGAGHITAALDEKALTNAWAFLDKHLKPIAQKPAIAETPKPAAPAELAPTGK
jgi:acetyl esterase/lipase